MEDILWKAIRREIELNLDSTDYNPSEKQLDELTDVVINDDNLWRNFTEDLMAVIEGELK